MYLIHITKYVYSPSCMYMDRLWLIRSFPWAHITNPQGILAPELRSPPLSAFQQPLCLDRYWHGS